MSDHSLNAESTLPPQAVREDANFELSAEAITVRVRWFGLCVGFVLVNFVGRQTNQPVLNGILTIGALYAVLDTLWSLRGRVFLSRWPLLISLMEAAYIGLLCFFDGGLESPFRFFYFLSLLVCAFRYSPAVTYTTFALHAASFAGLALAGSAHPTRDSLTLPVMIVLMGWVTWASTALALLVKSASNRLAELNDELQRNQRHLEERIDARTKELRESQALLVHQEKQAAFGLLAAGIAHEVGNPLAAISSLVQMLNRRHPDEYTRERLLMVDDQLRRIQRTLHELVDFSRPAVTQESLCDVHQAMDAALNIAKYYKRKKGKRIVTRYAQGLPKVRLIRDQLVQVFLNLILNAMDATDEGGVIDISTQLEAGWLHVKVQDEGHGISSKEQERLFQPYFTTKPTGTGLGLFVCRRLMTQMRGKIELTQSTPHGTTFTVSLAYENSGVHQPSALPADPAREEVIAP